LENQHQDKTDEDHAASVIGQPAPSLGTAQAFSAQIILLTAVPVARVQGALQILEFE